MKKFFFAVCMLCSILMLSSCYSSSVCMGNMKPETPCVKIATVHNHHFISGLAGEGKIRAKDYMEGEKDYKVKHQITFLDGLLSSITMGIYTPSTTKFYVPLRSIRKGSSKSRARQNDDEEEDEE